METITGESVRLHLGSGYKYWPGWINIDMMDADIIHDVKTLPMFENESVDEIQAIHVFEHFSRMDIDVILKEWRRVLKNGGKLVMEMPSMDKIAGLIKEGETNIRYTLAGIFGDPREGPLMQHHYCWQDEELKVTLKKAGFNVKLMEPVFHVPKRDLRVEAIKNGI